MTAVLTCSILVKSWRQPLRTRCATSAPASPPPKSEGRCAGIARFSPGRELRGGRAGQRARDQQAHSQRRRPNSRFAFQRCARAARAVPAADGREKDRGDHAPDHRDGKDEEALCEAKAARLAVPRRRPSAQRVPHASDL